MQHYKHNPSMHLTARRKAHGKGAHRGGRDDDYRKRFYSAVNSFKAILAIPHDTLLFFFFLQQKEHLRQEKAFGSAVCSQPCKTTGRSLYFHLHHAGE